MSIDNILKGNTKKWTPPEPEEAKAIEVVWDDLVWTGVPRVLRPEEELERDRYVANILGGAVARSFPDYDYYYAIATIRVLWPRLPDWMDWLISHDRPTAEAILEEVMAITNSFRVAYGGARKEGSEEPRIRVTAKSIASVRTSPEK
jgi:hypothetical protein